MAYITFCEYARANDYQTAFSETVDKIMDEFGHPRGTIAATTLIEHPIHIADEWDEVTVFPEAQGFIERDSYGEIGRTTALDCGITGDNNEHMWILYGRTEF